MVHSFDSTPPCYDGVFVLPDDLQLACGQVLTRPKIAWRRVGSPGLPAILVLGGISASRAVWSPESANGWWQELIGPGQGLDTSRYQILSCDFLGGNGASEGPANSSLAAERFPEITTHDQARALAGLLPGLGIEYLEHVIGSSYGGMVALALCELYPQLVGRALVICAAHEPWPLATGWRHVQRECVRFGLRHQDAETGLKLARALAVTTYRSASEFAERFNSASCTDYLEHCGQSFSQRFDPYAYLCLSSSIDSHRIDPAQIQVPLDLIGFSSDGAGDFLSARAAQAARAAQTSSDKSVFALASGPRPGLPAAGSAVKSPGWPRDQTGLR